MGVVGWSVAVEIVAECPRCQAPMPLPGAVSAYRCASCGELVLLAPRWWERVLFRATAEALLLPPGRGRMARIRIVPGARLLYGPEPPRCLRCGEELRVRDVIVWMRDGVDGAFCPHCGARLGARPLPPELMNVHPLLSAVIGEHLDGGARTAGVAPRWHLLLQMADDSDQEISTASRGVPVETTET